MELDVQTIRKRLRKLRRLQISGTQIGLRNQVQKLSEDLAEMHQALTPEKKTKKKREETEGQDREEHGGHDRSDS